MFKRLKTKHYIILGVLLLAGWITVSELTKGVQPTRVSTEKVQRRTIVQTVSASGRIQPETELKISPDVSGEIMEMNVREGDSVVKGQLLCRINPDLYASGVDRTRAGLENTKASMESAKARIAQAESKLNELTSNYNRNKKLHEQKVISDMEWESIQSLFLAAKSDLDAAKQNFKAMEYTVLSSKATMNESEKQLHRTNLYAPANGIVTKLAFTKGERVVGTAQMAGSEIMRISDLNFMEVSVDVNENDITKISLGDSADIEVDAFSGRIFKGIVSRISNSANITGVSSDQITNFSVKIRVLQSSYADLIKVGKRYPFRPGLSASVDIKTEKVIDVLTVPIEAVTTRSKNDLKGEKTSSKDKQKKMKDEDETASETQADAKDLQELVFNFSNGKALIKPVKTGIQDDSYIEIKEGVSETDEVITGPYQDVSNKLKNNTAVKKVKKEELFEVKK